MFYSFDEANRAKKKRGIDKAYGAIDYVSWKEYLWKLLLYQKEENELKKQIIMNTINLTKGGFLRKVANYEANPNEWKFLGDKPALIDFYASWCGPCKSLSPVLDELAKEYSGKLDIYKVNVDNEQELASFFRIRSVPTLLFVPMEGVPQINAGAPSKADLKRFLDSFIG